MDCCGEIKSIQHLICAIDGLAGGQHVVRRGRGQRGRGRHGLRHASRSLPVRRGLGESVEGRASGLGNLLDLRGGEVKPVGFAGRIHLERIFILELIRDLTENFSRLT